MANPTKPRASTSFSAEEAKVLYRLLHCVLRGGRSDDFRADSACVGRLLLKAKKLDEQIKRRTSELTDGVVRNVLWDAQLRRDIYAAYKK